MKLNTLLIATASLLWACGGGVNSNEVKIEGAFPGNDQVTLTRLTPESMEAVDTLILDSTGNFEFQVETSEEPRFYVLGFDGGNNVMLLAEGGESIMVNCDEDVPARYTVEGSEGSKLLRKANIMLDTVYQQVAALEQELDPVFRAAQPDQYDSLTTIFETRLDPILEKHEADIKNYIDENLGSPATVVALYQRVGNIPLFDVHNNFDLFEKVSKGLNEKHPGSAYANDLAKTVEQARPTAVGQMAPDFTLNTPEGNQLSLSDLKGQVVLVDFWASWCRPCRMENPNIVKAYNKYKDAGFTVLGVSLDGLPNQQDPKAEWISAIEKDELAWAQVSDLQGWNTPLVQLYNFRGIPHSVLVDTEGEIIAKNLRGKDLHEKLAEIFNS